MNNPLIVHPYTPPRTASLYFWEHSIVWEYKTLSENFQNTLVDDAPWNILHTWNVRVGFSRALFESIDHRYDGHTVKGFTLLGLSFTRSYTYDSRPIADKEKDEK